ncbi:MAG: hypothetical protein HUJ68_05780 [Clostridia bacterium]|nr:hypothetical protein [Clostridia bacterium]
MKKKLILVLLLIVIIFARCTNKNSNDEYKFKEEYESLNGLIREKDGKTIRTISIPANNRVKYSTEEEIIQKIDNGETFVIYFGYSDCPWCRSILPTLIKVIKKRNLPVLYYVCVEDIRDTLTVSNSREITTVKSGSDGYYKLLEKLAPVLNDYSLNDSEGKFIKTNEKRIYAPNIVSIIKGIPTQMVEGISKSQDDGYTELTKDMTKESYDIFDKFLDPVIADLYK